MFGPKKPPAAAAGKKPNGVDVLIQKLAALPPAMDLLVAAVVGGYSLVAIFVDGAKFVGLVCILIGLIFALLGINAVMREMKAFKQIEANSTPEGLRSMKRKHLEQYLTALFSLDGYRVRSAIGELDRFDDADLIAVKKDQTMLIQFNHFDEDLVDIKPIQSLHKAATAFQATGCIAITFGKFSANATDWARRKEVNLLNVEDVIAMACRLTGKSVEEAHPEPPAEVQEEVRHEVQEVLSGHHRFLFVDFSGLDHGLSHLADVLRQHPAYQVIASTLPMGKDLEAVREGLQECGNRLIGKLEGIPEGRFFAIQKHLSSAAEGKHATWLAIDSEPRQFPEGCTELIAVNRAFGFDSSAAQRLVDAMLLVDRRHTAAA